MVRKIRDISELVEFGFGQPWPRHGLQLLYWLVHECIYHHTDTDVIILRFDPEKGNFGFHIFENRYIQRNKKLLPNMRFPYYLVGNLKSPGAEMLPDFVKEFSDVQNANSNADRIIINVQEYGEIGKVYLTTHINQSDYDSRATFHISRTLLLSIKSYQSIDDFLKDTGYQKPIYQMLCIALPDITDTESQTSSRRSDISTHTNSDKEKKRCVCGCIIL